MPSPIRHTEGSRSWFARDAAPDRSPVAFLPVLGEWSEAKEALLLEWREAILATRPRGRPVAARDGCPACARRAEEERIEAEVQRRLAARLPGPALVAAATVTPLGADIPKPEAVMEAYMAAEEPRLEATTLMAARSCIVRVIRALGNDFHRWDGFWAWWRTATDREGQPLSEGSKKNTATAILSMLGWARRAGLPWSKIGYVVREEERPQGLSVKQRREQNPMGDEDDNGVPFTLAETRAILRANEAPNVPTYLRLSVLLGAYHALNPADCENLLTNVGRFVERSQDPKGDLGLWYLCGRQKTNTRIFVPLAAPVVEALRPYLSLVDGALKIDIKQRIPGPSPWRKRFAQVREAAGVAYVEGEEMKRFRNTVRHEVKDVLGVPDSVTKCLMAHRIRNGADIGTTYDSVDPLQMVDAITKWTAVLTAPAAATVSA